jgi:hypothetical protein
VSLVFKQWLLSSQPNAREKIWHFAAFQINQDRAERLTLALAPGIHPHDAEYVGRDTTTWRSDDLAEQRVPTGRQPSRLSKRRPRGPPRPRLTGIRISLKRTVCRACGTKTAGTRSVKSLSSHLRLRQRQRPSCSSMVTEVPWSGKSSRSLSEIDFGEPGINDLQRFCEENILVSY